jgi:RNA polymerase sigma-70 factor (ECF subfamily)
VEAWGTPEGSDEDRDPLAALQAGDPRAFEAFVRARAGSLAGFFQQLGAERGEAEDLTQDVFLKLYRGAAHYRAEGSFAAYCMRLARNAWIDRQRRRAARPAELFAAADAPESEPEGRERPPGAALEAREEEARLRRALGSLPSGQARAFDLAVIRARPYAEVAAALGIPVGTVKSRVHHAVRALRAALEPERELR